MPIANLLGRLASKRVWVLGDLMLDEYVEGDVDRLSPEAPVPAVRVRSRTTRLGGAANVARACVTLGARVSLGGVVGDDGAGEQVIALCKEAGLGTDAVVAIANRPTTRKTRVLSRGQQMIRLEEESIEAVDPSQWGPVVEALESDSTDVIILSDYAKGFLTDALLARVLDGARRRQCPAGVATNGNRSGRQSTEVHEHGGTPRAVNRSGRQSTEVHEHGGTPRAVNVGGQAPLLAPALPVVVDPKSRDFARYRGATVLTPNLSEVERALGTALDPTDDAALTEAGLALLDLSEAQALVITLGALGMVIVERGKAMVRLAASAREVYDPTGAGDIVAAMLGLGLAASWGLHESARLANAAAGVAVGKVGAQPVSPAEIASRFPPTSPQALLSMEELAEQVAWWRILGRRIVFTNGCFDLLHIGHLTLLREAARFGDVLVVAINSDASVRRLKGPERPLLPATERADLLSAFECVDSVVVFEADTPRSVIEMVRPDVLVKGADYAEHEVVGAEIVRSYGGRVELVPLAENRSTTVLLDQIRAHRES